MGTATYGGKALIASTRVSGEGPLGTASFRQQSIHASFQHPPPHPQLNRTTGYRVCGVRTANVSFEGKLAWWPR